MNVTILGTANAWGPNPFLQPPAPWPMSGALSNGTKIEMRKYRTSLLIQTNDEKSILVDCSPDFSHQLREFKIDVPDALVITHSHPDHIGGLDELNLYKPTSKLPIPAYATKACWDCVKTQRGLGYVIQPLGLITENHLLENPNSPSITIGSVTVTPFPVEHHFIVPGALGFCFEEKVGKQIKRVVYTGDLWAISNPAHPMFNKQIDLAIIECDRWDRLAGPSVGGGHMSFQEVIRMIKDGVFSNPRPKQITLVHFGDNGPIGTSSTYADWRTAVIKNLEENGLINVMPNRDAVIGYEGLTLCA